METTDDEDAVTSSADSDDCDSVVSAIFNRAGRLTAGPATYVPQQRPRPRRPPDDGRPNVFTYDAVVPAAPVAGSVAASVYVLIDQGQCMSADMRLMWYLKRLGTVLTADRDLSAGSPDQCRIVSYVARDVGRTGRPPDNDTFVMDTGTRVYFLTAVCNMVYCLDMSPSNCSVDIQRGHVMLDEMIVALKRTVKGFIRPFIVPGSTNVLFEPQVYVTVIVHTPFYTSLAQQVLLQGWLINNKNFHEFIKTVSTEMNGLENALAKTKIIGKIQSDDDKDDDEDDDDDDNTHGNETYRTIYDRQDRKLSNNNNSLSSHASSKSHRNNDNNFKIVTPVTSTSPDSGFINTLRYGMLALRLLPQSSISNLIVITDGMITLADIQVLDSVLNQLRCTGVACSFLHVSSQFHPYSSHGLVPYSELMQLISTATCGFYLNTFPKTIPNNVVNDYHDKFIMWSFKRGVDEYSNNTANLSCTPTCVRSGEWTVRNANFYGNRQTQLVSKKQINNNYHANLDNVVCCRMREGFIIEDIQFRDAGSITPVKNKVNYSKLQLKFILPWTNHIYVEYDISIKWPCSTASKSKPLQAQNTVVAQVSSNTTQPTKTSESDDSSKIFFTITVKGPYEFLHDITCNRSKKSQLLTQLAPKCQFNLSSCRLSSVHVTGTSTTITRNDSLMPPESSYTNQRIVSSKYRQALINRFWSTMRSIVQSDMLIKHLETYSPNTGHLTKQEQNENHDRQHPPILESQPSPPLQSDDSSSLSPNSINSISPKIEPSVSTVITETKAANVLTPGVPKRSPLRNGIPLFYHPPTSSYNPYAIKQSQVRLNDQQGYDHQHQQFADFWKPICALDPETQWPKWFSTYRLGGGVIILKHDRPLPAWLHVANPVNNRYQSLTCREATDALFALLKQWCSFILIDDHAYVKCLDECETQNGSVSFCIAQVSLKSPTCCCVVLHLAFQSSVPVCVHLKIINDLTNSIEFLDSTTAVKPFPSFDHDDDSTIHEENEEETQEETNEKELESLAKSTPSPRYLYILDKPLDKILVKYERIPSQFTTVIFPDGSQPYPAPAVTTSSIIRPNPKLNFVKKPTVSQDEPTGIERKTVTTTTTLSRYLYHRRWIWSSGCKRYNKYTSNASQMLQIQLARTLSVLTHVRLKEGFRFAHSSSGIINMVLKVDMIEGSPSCPSTPTSHCVIQYVLFPPNIPHKNRLKDQIDALKKKSNEDERSSTSSFDELQLWEKRLQHERYTITSETGDSNCCCSHDNVEDDYQIIMECWIEPQHGKVVPNKKLNVDYMTGLMYEQLADAIWQVDFDCISSLYTFDHMQDMCTNHEVSIGYPDYDIIDAEQNKSVVVDAGRIYKLPFTFSLLNVLPKSRHKSSMTYSLFTINDDSDTDANNDKDDNKLNSLLERSFYTRLRAINDRSFEVDGAHSTVDLNQPIAKVNNQDIGQCFIKRIDNTRLLLTVAPSFWEKQRSVAESSEDGLQPLNRSRANTWHHTKRVDGLLCPQPLDNSKHYFRTLSVGSKPLKTTEMSWDQLKLDRNLLTPDARDNENRCMTVGGFTNAQDFPTNMSVEIYECCKEDIQNILMFDSYSFGQCTNDITDNENSLSSSTSSTIHSDENRENILYTSSGKRIVSEEPVDTFVLDKYLQRIGTVYDQSFVTSVFHALHLGIKVQHADIQRALDRCHHRLVTFEITNYIKAVCDHFKENSNSWNICPTDDTTIKLHHNLIHKTFSSILDRHMLKTIDNHPDFFFYDFIEKFGRDDESDDCCYTNHRPTDDNSQTQYLPNILVGNPAHKINFDSNEVNEEDLFPLFVQLVCSVKTNDMVKSQVVHSLPTCIVELMGHVDNENEPTKNMDLTNLKVSLNVYCFVLPNYDYNRYDDDDNDVDEDDYDTFNKTISLEQLHCPISNNSIKSIKQIECYEKPFIYLSAVLPTRHAQGLAAFIAEVEWCMRDEMAAGLLKDPVVTPDTLAKVIEHVSSSPCSSSNDYQKLVLHFVPSLRPSKLTSADLFIQKLNHLDIMLDIGNDDVDRLYSLEKSSNYIFYVVKKDTPLDTNCEHKTSESWLTKPELPKFWIILQVQEDKKCQNDNNICQNNSNVNTLVVNIFFHCRFSELDVGGRYSAVKESVKLNVEQTATIINQTVLLSRLHDTRICDPLLEPIIEGHNYSDDDIKENEKMEKTIKYFTKGQFKCPVVWTTTFSLHPRIQQSTPLLMYGGVHVLSAVLDKFSIRNRRNMFVYKESISGYVFYLRFYKNSNPNQEHQTCNVSDSSFQYDSEDDDSISRCSSATSTTAPHSLAPSYHLNVSRKHSDDFNYGDNKFNQTPGKRSLKLWATDLKDVENLTCNVHGIAPVGTEIRIDLVEVLQNRLNDTALEVLTTLLHRNPSCRMFLDDVLFIQPAGGPVDITSQISLPMETKVTKYFARTLKRTAAKFSLLPPKFFESYHRFNHNYDTLDALKPVIRSYFLYNYPCGGVGGRQISGKRGLSCILYDVYSYENNLINNSYDYPMNPWSFEKYVKTTLMGDNLESNTEHSGYVKIFAWCRGRVNMESLKKKITSIVTFTLWDVYVEQFLYEEIIIVEEPKAYVNPLCINFLTKWIAFGARLGVPFAHHSNIQCRLHINHVLREFKTHLTWFGGYKSDRVTTISTRYFYVPSTEYGLEKDGHRSNNIIIDSFDPLQLNQKQDGDLLNDLVFYEWQTSDSDSIICPPSAACVLIIVSVICKQKLKQDKSKQNEKTINGQSDSDTDNGVVEPQAEAATNGLEDFTPDSVDALVKQQNTDTSIKIQEKQQPVKQRNKVSKFIMVVVSGESVHTVSYNCHNNDNQQTTVNHLSRWLQLRSLALDLAVYKMTSLRNPHKYDQINDSELKNLLSKIMKTNPELLLDFNSYAAYIEDTYASENHGGPNNLTNTVRNQAKLNDSGTEDKKKKLLVYSKDFHDKSLEKLVHDYKEQQTKETHRKILYEMWTNEDDMVSKEALKTFNSHSRLYHYCLTPLLFLTQWRNESHSTRDFLMDTNKSRDIFSAPQPIWHKKLCARLSNDFSRYIKTNPASRHLKPFRVNNTISTNIGVSSKMDYNASLSRYYKQSVKGPVGGIVLLETGVSQPFFYIKLSLVDKYMIGNQVQDKFPSMLSLLDRLEVLTQKLHLHSFTYDFHACILSERLIRLVQMQILERRSLSILLEHINPAQSSSTNKTESGCAKNVIAGFFDDFLKYYEKPPLYSNCLVQEGVVKHTKLLVTSTQLYKYILNNCSRNCNNMAVIKICDSQSVDVDDGSFLFDDNFDYDNDGDDDNITGSQPKPGPVVPSDFIIVRHMTGIEIQQIEESEMNSNFCKSGFKEDDWCANYQHEISGLYDVTLVMTLSVKNLVLDCHGEISLPYYVLVTRNDRDILEKKETVSAPEPIFNGIDPRFDHGNRLSVSTSVPTVFYSNLSFRSFTHLRTSSCINLSSYENNNGCVKTRPCNKLQKKRESFMKFYQKKAAKLITLTLDSAAKRCFSHLLWQKFNKFFDQPRGGTKTMTTKDVEEVINHSELFKPLIEYAKNLAPLIEDFTNDPLWFNMLHKFIAQQILSSSNSFKTMRYRIFKNNNNSEHQYLVVLPNSCCSIELNAFIVIDNGNNSYEDVPPPAASSMIHIVLKRNVVGFEEVNKLIELVGNILCFHTWRSLPITSSHSNSSIISRVKRLFKN